jgi:hypothetical protein
MEKPVETRGEKHFLDTSVARPMLVGTRRYKAYFAAEFGDNLCYINKYVQMEFKRSYLSNAIAFYFILHLSTVPTIGDALRLWSNRFKGSELKAILQLAGDLFDSHRFELENPRDKQKALDALGRYIKRLEIKLRGKFKDTGINATRCARAEVIFNVDLDNMAEGFRKFVAAFDDVQSCRSHCRVDDFLLNRHGEQVHSYVKDAAPLAKNQANRGFKNIAKNLDDTLQKGATACTCKMCEKVGDAIIALETPRDMRLEHTDNSFNHLCPPLGLNHKQHPSELKIVQSSSGQ